MPGPVARTVSAELDTPIRRLRLLSRLAVYLLLDLVDIARGGRHVLDTLLISVIVQANHAAPTDETLRPISVNALAASGGLPFETVRRRVRKLAEEGLCRFVDGGVIVPAAVLSRPGYFEKGERAYERLRAFYYEVSDLGLVSDLPPPSDELAADDYPLATAMRLLTDYVLRETAGLLASMGGMIDGLIAWEVFGANTAHFGHHLRGGEGYDARDMVADERRRPVTVTTVAAELGMPQETVRRHVARLVEAGTCRRVAGGLIVPAEVFAREHVRSAVFGNAANLQRLCVQLSALGVLRLWDRTRLAA
jgi:DNA-binding transcriptional ArsR family regulator